MSVVYAATAGPVLTAPVRATRTIRVGLLGLGHVGQAVARVIQSSAEAFRARGLSVRVEAALVREPRRSRRCPRPPRITSNAEAFLRGRYDLVIEALGGVEPARTLLSRLLDRGVHVVSANKAVVAAHGEALHRIARRGGAHLRYEAAALAGVPFIGAFSRRPLVASVTGITAIVNGTSNYVLTLLARGEAATLDEAVRRAQALGYAEPDPAADIGGRDAADKLLLLLRDCAGVSVRAADLEVTGIDGVTAAIMGLTLHFAAYMAESIRGAILGVDRRPTDEEWETLQAAVPRQPLHVAVLLAGERERSGWWGRGRPVSWADALEAVRRLARDIGTEVEVRAAAYAPWHPGRCAEIVLAGEVIGHGGELHPKVCKAYGVPPRTAAAEIDLDALMRAAVPVVPAPTFSTYPVAKEDVALVVDATVSAAAVEGTLREGAGPLLESVRLFDVYTGEQIGEGKKSLAYAMRFRAPDRTLTDAEVAEAREAAVALAVERHGAVHRS